MLLPRPGPQEGRTVLPHTHLPSQVSQGAPGWTLFPGHKDDSAPCWVCGPGAGGKTLCPQLAFSGLLLLRLLEHQASLPVWTEHLHMGFHVVGGIPWAKPCSLNHVGGFRALGVSQAAWDFS